MEISLENNISSNNNSKALLEDFEISLKSIKFQWLIFYLLFITIIEFIFFTKTDLLYTLLNIILIFNCIYDLYTLNWKRQSIFNSKIRLRFTALKYFVFLVCIFGEIFMSHIYNNFSYTIYNEYQLYFSLSYLISFGIRAFLMIYIIYIVKGFIKTE